MRIRHRDKKNHLRYLSTSWNNKNEPGGPNSKPGVGSNTLATLHMRLCLKTRRFRHNSRF